MGRDKMGDVQKQIDREGMDFYATNPKDVTEICKILNIGSAKQYHILEPCAGNGHIAKVLKDLGQTVVTNDIIERDYPLDYTIDYLKEDLPKKDFDVVLTNPPFKYAKEFIERSLEYAPVVVVIAKLDLLETAKRKALNNEHLQQVYVHTSRARFARGGEDHYFKKSSSMATAWYVYVRNKKGQTKLTVI